MYAANINLQKSNLCWWAESLKTLQSGQFFLLFPMDCVVSVRFHFFFKACLGEGMGLAIIHQQKHGWKTSNGPIQQGQPYCIYTLKNMSQNNRDQYNIEPSWNATKQDIYFPIQKATLLLEWPSLLVISINDTYQLILKKTKIDWTFFLYLRLFCQFSQKLNLEERMFDMLLTFASQNIFEKRSDIRSRPKWVQVLNSDILSQIWAWSNIIATSLRYVQLKWIYQLDPVGPVLC